MKEIFELTVTGETEHDCWLSGYKMASYHLGSNCYEVDSKYTKTVDSEGCPIFFSEQKWVRDDQWIQRVNDD